MKATQRALVKSHNTNNRRPKSRSLPKAPTGIQGLDEVTLGGLPRGRPALVCGGAGCGKTLLAMEFIVRGATAFDEPGVFVSFEETSEELAENVRSLGFDLDQLVKEGKLLLDYVHVERSEIEETGEFDLSGLFIRLDHAIKTIGAKRVVLDTLEILFGGFSDSNIVRAELRRLFRWLKERGVTAVITGERGEGTLTRHGIEEYVADCVIVLDHRVTEQLSTRRLRILKYRGTTHGTNEYPFLIDEQGISVLPVTSLRLQQEVSNERITSGVGRLDTMLGGKGFYRGSCVLVTGTAGTGKTSLAAHFAEATCSKGERCLYLAFEESQSQLFRNMRSIGIDLAKWEKKGLLQVHAIRPTAFGLEMHLVTLHKLVSEMKPDAVIIDPVTTFLGAGSSAETEAMLMRVLDFLKGKQITGFLTSLSQRDEGGGTNVFMSSLIDTWIHVRDIEASGERNRGLNVLKSRGMAHSNQIREFRLTDHGVELTDVYRGPEGVVTGSLRIAQESREAANAIIRDQVLARKQKELESKRAGLESQIAALRAQFDSDQAELELLIAEEELRREALTADRLSMAASRKADTESAAGASPIRRSKPGARK